ncbi:putative acetyltransferase [Phenylobacterium haematophilum]|uniref:Putative acetyltransferase n=1 Tax=Phenylobacterium haematophilum TaxID=98513 RepID=A0A839ZYX2_9CAUL|nr:GNAT family N-acetyltransferase [Phenylobacterium haematophilum]MBB3891795.1 putative acetyltransferase [Phenylobacterium haematophilum]
MNQDVLIRGQEPADVSDITELLNQPRVVWGTLQLPYTSVAARIKRFESAPPGWTPLVAEIAGKVIGQAGLNRLDGRRGHVAVVGLSVHDDFAGRGVGTALMAALTEQADRWLGLRRIELTVWTDNAAAIALYERFGFEREGLHRAFALRDGEYVDALAMARLRP